MEDKLNFEISGLSLGEEAQYYLLNTAKWAKFLAIVGFVFCAIMVLAGIGMSAFMSSIGDTMAQTNPAFSAMGGGLFFGVFYIAFAALYFFPCLYLYQFAISAKRGIEEQDSPLISAAMDKQHSMYKFMGILMAIMLGMYALIIAVALIVGGFAAAAA